VHREKAHIGLPKLKKDRNWHIWEYPSGITAVCVYVIFMDETNSKKDLRHAMQSMYPTWQSVI
jgi:hypothetical protein